MAILGPVWLLLRGLAVLQNRSGSDIGTCLGSPLMMQWTAPVVGIAKSETAGYDEKLRESAVVKGCRTPAGDRRVRRLASAGRCPTSLRGGNRGGIRLGGGACSVYGDLTAAGWLSGVVWSAGSRGSGPPRHRRDGLAPTLRWRSRALLADLRAWGGVGQSGIVANDESRHPSGFSTG
jgi:hypothetical protein